MRSWTLRSCHNTGISSQQTHTCASTPLVPLCSMRSCYHDTRLFSQELHADIHAPGAFTSIVLGAKQQCCTLMELLSLDFAALAHGRLSAHFPHWH